MQALGLVILVLNWNKHASAMFQGSWLCTCFGQWLILLFGHWPTLQCYPPIFKSICQNVWVFEAGMGIPLISFNKGTGMSFGLPVNTVWVKVSFKGSLYYWPLQLHMLLFPLRSWRFIHLLKKIEMSYLIFPQETNHCILKCYGLHWYPTHHGVLDYRLTSPSP